MDGVQSPARCCRTVPSTGHKASTDPGTPVLTRQGCSCQISAPACRKGTIPFPKVAWRLNESLLMSASAVNYYYWEYFLLL